jgi:arylsulfatase A-like enzyme
MIQPRSLAGPELGRVTEIRMYLPMSQPQMPTRVIWITSDHMRHDHIAANGNAAMVTPALDGLAGRGVNFHECFVQNPVCMPSRCSFMTGLYPQQTGVTDNGHCLRPDFEPNVATVFKAAGYQTAQIGKLHFQPHEEMDFDPRPRHTYGFDVFWPSEERGNYSDAYYHWLEGKHPQYASLMRVPRSSDPQRHWTERTPQVVDAPWQVTHAGWVVDSACRYLGSRSRSRHFLHLGFYNPHPPLTPVRDAWEAYDGRDLPLPQRRPQEWRDKPEPLASMLRQRADWSEADFADYRRGLAAMVTEMDMAIGALVQWLRSHGLLDDTLLVFSSDHGDFAGDHGITHKGPAFYDQVMRVPLILHWPAGLGQERRDCRGLMEMVDLLPTLLGLCGSAAPPTMMGRDLSPSLRRGEEPPPREDVIAYHAGGMAMLRTPTHKYLRYEPAGTEVLYDLQDQAALEQFNIAEDPAQATVLSHLRTRLLRRALVASRSPLPKHYLY